MSEKKNTLAIGTVILGLLLAAGLVYFLSRIESPPRLDTQQAEPRATIDVTQEPLTEEVVTRFIELYQDYQVATKEAYATYERRATALTSTVEKIQLQREILQLFQEVISRSGWSEDSFHFVFDRISLSLKQIEGKPLPEDETPPSRETLALVRKYSSVLKALLIKKDDTEQQDG